MLKYSYTLVLVLTFLIEVDIHLIAYEQLVAAVGGAYLRRVYLVAVAHMYAVEATADEHRERVVGAVAQASVEQLLVAVVYQPSCYVGTPVTLIGLDEGGHRYS